MVGLSGIAELSDVAGRPTGRGRPRPNCPNGVHELSKACKPDLRTRPVQRLLVDTRVRQPIERRRAVRRPDTPEAAMFEEAQLYAPVTRSGDDVTVHLGDDHPGAVDPEYRARRNALAALAMDWQPGAPPPIATYTEAE